METLKPARLPVPPIMRLVHLTTLALATTLAAAAHADTAEDVARQLSNPVAALISVPFQFNHDREIGPARDGSRWLLNIQPVVPFDLNDDWNIISRTILPVVWQEDVFPGAGRQSGIGDIVQSVFFSPKVPTAGGVVWGVGPVFLLPTGTDDLLTTDKWGAGPTGVVLRQQGPWTVGTLANHIWSFAGSSSRADVNATFVQPFVTYTLPTATTFVLNTESTYDWEARQWSVPINTGVTQVLRLGDQLVQVGVLGRYWAESPQQGPHGWGLRLNVTLLFPR
jgi:hypothetical protein